MNADERFDQLLRSALERQADESARNVPSLERSVRRLAERLGPEPERRPLITLRAGTGRSLQLITLLLLLALIAAAVAIGAQLLLRPTFEPPRFGFEGQCSTPALDGIVYTAQVDDQPLVLYEDGRLIRLIVAAGETRSALLDTAGGLERRLSPRGIELIFERVGETIPAPGCRHLRATEGTGQISVFTPAGLMELSWHPSNSGRRLTPDEEVAAEALDSALAEPASWLPPEAWAEPFERRVAPDRWGVMVELTPSGFNPGDEVGLSTGGLLPGSDPRYARVVLPDGQEPAEFGAEIAVQDGTSFRCGVLGTEDARRLSDSLDALPLAMHDEEALFTEDLTTKVFIYVFTAYPQEPDCARQARYIVPAANPTQAPPLPTSQPGDDLAGIDPCSLVPAAVDAMYGSGVIREQNASILALGTPAQSCNLVAPADFAPSAVHVSLTLYPRSVDLETAGGLAVSVFGGGLVEDTIAGKSVWVNECLAATLPCTGAIAAWADSRFLVVEFDRAIGGGPPTTTLDKARSVVAAILEGQPQ